MLKEFINKIMNRKTEPMKEGTVKFFNEAKGFGFIKINDSDQDIFVHSTNVLDKIRENDRVQFQVEQVEKGLSAVNVKLV